jgi:PAS domain-containing protein
MRILLVERKVEQGCSCALQNSPLVTAMRICESAEEALEALTMASRDFDLIAVDYDLPGMSGLQFCRQVLGQGISLPFVLFAPEGFETLQDITNHRKAENALAESRHWLSQIFQGSAVPTFVIDQEHRVSEWNIAWEKMTGIKAEKIIGTRNQWKAFSDHERPVLADFILDAVSEEEIARQYGDKYRRSLIGEGYEVEDFFPALGKEGKWLFFTASPLRDATGMTIGAIETLQDVPAAERRKTPCAPANRNIANSV